MSISISVSVSVLMLVRKVLKVLCTMAGLFCRRAFSALVLVQTHCIS